MENNKMAKASINTVKPSGFELVAMILRIRPGKKWAKAKPLLIQLADYCGEGNYTTRVGQATLAGLLGVDVKSVGRHLTILEGEELISTHEGPANQTQKHTLNVPLIAELYLASVADRTKCPITIGQNVVSRSDKLSCDQTSINRPVLSDASDTPPAAQSGPALLTLNDCFTDKAWYDDNRETVPLQASTRTPADDETWDRIAFQLYETYDLPDGRAEELLSQWARVRVRRGAKVLAIEDIMSGMHAYMRGCGFDL